MDEQLQGTQADLKHNTPLNVEHDGRTGRMEKQLIGSEVPMSNRPVELQEFNKNTLDGEMQLMGSQAPCSYKPHHGYESGTPMSDRAVKQSK